MYQWMQGNGVKMEDHRLVKEHPRDAMGKEVYSERKEHMYEVLIQVWES